MGYKEDSAKYRGEWKGEIPGRSGDPKLMDFSKLVQVGSGGEEKRLIPPAANSYNRMKAAQQRDLGLNFDVGPSTFRSLQFQINKCKVKNCDGKSNARPGYSVHGWGRAIDLALLYGSCGNGTLHASPKTDDGKKLFNWMCNNAIKFGWVNYLAECWHWEYIGEPPAKPRTYANPVIGSNSYTATPGSSNTRTEEGSDQRNITQSANTSSSRPGSTNTPISQQKQEPPVSEDQVLQLFASISNQLTKGQAEQGFQNKGSDTASLKKADGKTWDHPV